MAKRKDKRFSKQDADVSKSADDEELNKSSEDNESLESEPEPASSSGEEEIVEYDEIQELRKKLDEKNKEVDELRNQFLMYRAETENFKKRLQKEKEDFTRYANEKIIKELISIYDNLERALAAPEGNAESLKEGVKLISKQFFSLLEKEKVTQISGTGGKFDPAFHEALCHMESEDHEDNTIIEEYSKGYMLNGRVIIPGKVVVSKKPSNNQRSEKKENKNEHEEDQESPSAAPNAEK
ncbi:MAG: nucleotide exchange factor GrpE [Nitrospinales bacterium]